MQIQHKQISVYSDFRADAINYTFWQITLILKKHIFEANWFNEIFFRFRQLLFLTGLGEKFKGNIIAKNTHKLTTVENVSPSGSTQPLLQNFADSDKELLCKNKKEDQL